MSLNVHINVVGWAAIIPWKMYLSAGLGSSFFFSQQKKQQTSEIKSLKISINAR